jgi:hypothetical protein
MFFADLSETTHLFQNRKEAISAVDGPPFCLKARGESKANNDVLNMKASHAREDKCVDKNRLVRIWNQYGSNGSSWPALLIYRS